MSAVPLLDKRVLFLCRRENTMKKVHEIIDKVLVFIETNIPTLMLIGVFLGFIVSIINRYIFQAGSPKVDEAYVICFCWLAVFSSPLATRN